MSCNFLKYSPLIALQASWRTLKAFYTVQHFTYLLFMYLLSRFLSIVGGSVEQIGSSGLQKCVESKVKTSSIEELARSVDTTPETLSLIVDGLTQPPGFDIRQSKTLATHSCTSNSALLTVILKYHDRLQTQGAKNTANTDKNHKGKEIQHILTCKLKMCAFFFKTLHNWFILN